MERPHRWTTYMRIAHEISKRSTCSRRRVGCVLTDGDYRVLATGYNGVPERFPHCTLEPCAGSSLPSGHGLDQCMAIHAEQNALMQCRYARPQMAFVTTFPCLQCQKMFLNTGIFLIVYEHSYETHPRVWDRHAVRWHEGLLDESTDPFMTDPPMVDPKPDEEGFDRLYLG